MKFSTKDLRVNATARQPHPEPMSAVTGIRPVGGLTPLPAPPGVSPMPEPLPTGFGRVFERLTAPMQVSPFNKKAKSK